MVHKARNGNFSLPGPRVVSPKVIYLYRKCKEFDLNCVSNRALTVACKHPGVVSPLGGSVLPSLSSCVLLRAVCCAVTRKFSNYLLVLLCLGVCIFFVTRFQSKLCDEICFTKNNKHPVYLWQCAASTCLLFWFNFLSTALASRSVEGVVGSQLFLGSRKGDAMV